MKSSSSLVVLMFVGWLSPYAFSATAQDPNPTPDNSQSAPVARTCGEIGNDLGIVDNEIYLAQHLYSNPLYLPEYYLKDYLLAAEMDKNHCWIEQNPTQGSDTGTPENVPPASK